MALSAVLGDEIEVVVGGEAVVLRPTLRAGISALNLHGAFATTIRKVLEIDTLTIRAIVESGAARPVEALRDLFGRTPLPAFADLVDPLADYLAILANGGVRPGEAAVEGGGGTHEEYFARLFKLGTGWLNWTPDETLDAPMPAIVSGYVGRQEMLSAIFGGASRTGGKDIPLDQKLKAGMTFLGTRKVART